ILELIETFLGYLAVAAVTYASIQELRGHRVGFREFCGRGLAQGGVAIRVALLSGIGLIVGFIALVIPAIILYVVWWVAIPVAVIERRGAIDSLRRSAELTKGYRWRIVDCCLPSSLRQPLSALSSLSSWALRPSCYRTTPFSLIGP